MSVKNDVFAYVKKQIVSKFVKIHMAKLLEVKTFISPHSCEVKNVRKLDFYIFNFFFQINLIEKVPSKYILKSVAILSWQHLFNMLAAYTGLHCWNLLYLLAV